MEERRLAVVTGASSGIGYELARIAAREGYDVIGVADEPALAEATGTLGGTVTPVQADLSTAEGVQTVLERIGGRPVDVLCANAGRGLGGRFIDQDTASWRRVLDTNVTGTLLLVHEVLRGMVARSRGRVLVTGSLAGFMAGSASAVYSASKAFLDSFTDALRDELRDVRGVTVTTLMPRATDTQFFDRAGLEGTRVDEGAKAPADEVARTGWDAMMAGADTRIPDR